MYGEQGCILTFFGVNLSFTWIFHIVNGVFIVILIYASDHKIATRLFLFTFIKLEWVTDSLTDITYDALSDVCLPSYFCT